MTQPDFYATMGPMSQTVHITAAYAFFPLTEDERTQLRTELIAFGQERGMRGLVLLATEGLNSTVSGTAQAIADWKTRLRALKSDMVFKDSTAEMPVFKRWSVKLKQEIVALQQPDIHPAGQHKHVPPAEWQKMLEQEDVVIIDARNDYEYQVGAFKNAVNCGTRTFSEFPEFVKNAAIPKDKKVMMYCTGGIRCEKALLEMEKHGYNDVYQLEGGILAYLAEFPHAAFEGECFVFDKRVAVDQTLKPSETFRICPHCGLPCTQVLSCKTCNKETGVCETCAHEEVHQTCSKECTHILRKRIASGLTAPAR